jgi:hypothetical protein
MTPTLYTVFAAPGGGGGVTTSEVYSISNPLDSAEQDVGEGTMYLDSSDLELMHDGADSEQIVAIVFPSVTIASGAMVTAAQVMFLVDEVRPDQSDVDVTINIYGELSGNPAAPSTTANDASDRTPTAASVC